MSEASLTLSAPAAASPRPARRFDMLILAAVFAALWELVAVRTGGVAISTPAQTLAYLATLLPTANFLSHAAATLEAFALSFVLSAILGLGLGLWFGARRFAGDVAEPILAGLYTIPKVTLYPVILLIFGLGMSAKVAFGVLHGAVPITLFTLGAIKALPPVYVRAARSMRLTQAQTMRAILIPACLGEIVGGIRIGFALTFLGVIIGEMFSSQRGLGFLLVSGLAQHNVPLTTSVVFAIVVAAIAANLGLLRLTRRFN